MATLVEEAKQSLDRIQQFDAGTLAREEDLGIRFSFADAVPAARRLIQLYQQLGLATLDDFSDAILQQVRQQADADFNRFDSLLKFAPDTQQNPSSVRTQLISGIESAYQATFQALYMPIAYGVSKSIDYQRMENEARASLQAVADRADQVTENIQGQQKQVEDILQNVRKAASEQGVSQQAIYFKDEADNHATLARAWLKYTVILAVCVAIYSIATLFIHKIPFFKPTNLYDSTQLIASKVLIFFVLSYMLVLAARNFLNNKHNEIVNKHRQNALMTFKALVDATKTEESRDVVLRSAASCIFSPQDTGYTRGQRQASAPTVTELLAKTVLKSEQ